MGAVGNVDGAALAFVDAGSGAIVDEGRRHAASARIDASVMRIIDVENTIEARRAKMRS
jgi:hypothetical protein